LAFAVFKYLTENYFCLGNVSKAYRIVDTHVGGRLRVWLQAKHKAARVGRKRFTDVQTAERLGLVLLRAGQRQLPCAKA
jgi:RNA-directed DNA polymerase